VARPLSPLQAAFCRHMLDPGVTATEAARRAGYSTSYATREAAKLVGKPQVAAKIAELRGQAERAAVAEYAVDKSAVRRGLHHEAQNAETPAARVRAWELLGKDIGMFTDRQEITLKRDPREMSKAELEEYLRGRGLLD
jgi:phage terminase small subunit